MPSINQVLERVSRARPDAIDDDTKAAWLLELDGQLYREVILHHRVHTGPCKRGPVDACPMCGGYGLDADGNPRNPEANGKDPMGICYNRLLDCSSCPACGWNERPGYPKAFPEDGDEPLLVGAPYDGLYDLYLMSKIDFINRETDNYNNSALAYNAALDEWKKAYHRSHYPIGGCGITGL